MSALKKVQRADTHEPVNVLDAAGSPYITDAPRDGREYVLRDGVWVNISEELKMARWFAKTDRVITNTTITSNDGSYEFPVTVRRVRVGNIYLYRVYMENLSGTMKFWPPGDHILGRPEDFPELANFEFSNQMAVPVYARLGNSIVNNYLFSGLVQPNGIILHLASTLSMYPDMVWAFEATRAQMGPWAS